MNQNWDEEKLRQVFRQLKRSDERLVPQFTKVCATPSDQTTSGGQFRAAHLLAASIAIILICLGAFVVFKRRSMPLSYTVAAGASVAIPTPQQPALPFVRSPNKQPLIAKRRALRLQGQQSVIAISEWRSPTNFLLAIPGDEFLKSVPQLNRSVVELKPILPEIKN